MDADEKIKIMFFSLCPLSLCGKINFFIGRRFLQDIGIINKEMEEIFNFRLAALIKKMGSP